MGFSKDLILMKAFIITAINSKAVNSPKEVSDILEEVKGKVMIQGVNKKGVKGYYSYYF